LLEMAVIESLPLRQQASSHRPWKRKIGTLKSVPSEGKSEFSWLPFECRSWELIRNRSGSEDAAVQPRTVVRDMFGNAVNLMLATGGYRPAQRPRSRTHGHLEVQKAYSKRYPGLGVQR
jgi:hypothetical protein